MNDYDKGVIVGAVLMGVVSLGVDWYRGFPRSIPANKIVQSGYVPPSKLEIECKDLDGNGESETIIKVDGKSYLLMYDKNNMPVIKAYEIKPAEGIQK